MNIKIRKYLKIAGFMAGVILTLLVIATLIINYFFKDQVIQYVVSQLNKQVDAQVSIRKVDFSLWKQFPNASVEFINVYAQSSKRYKDLNFSEGNDTLLVADRIFLEFNMIKLLSGHYELKRMNIKNGYVKLKVDVNSNTNFNIFKKRDKAPANDFHFKFNDVIFSNTIINYVDNRTSINFLGKADELHIKGNFGSTAVNLSIESNLSVSHLNVYKINYLHNKPVVFNCDLNVSNNLYHFNEAKFNVSGLKFLGTCVINMNEKPGINMVVEGQNLHLGNLFETLPENISLKLTNYKGKGTANMYLSVKGGIGKGADPNVNVRFNLTNGIVTEKSSGIKLSNIDLEGSFTNGLGNCLQTSEIKLNKFSSNFGNGSFSGIGQIHNFNNGSFSGNLISKTDLRDFKQFLHLDSLEQLNGLVESTISASGKLAKIFEFKFSDIYDLTISGQIKLENVAFKGKNSDYNFQQINGVIALNNDIFLNNLSFYIHENDFLVNGTLHNGIEYFLKRTNQLSLKAEIVSKNLDLSKYFSKDEKKNTEEYSRELLFPDNVLLDVKLTVNSFKLNKFNAKWISGYLNYKPRMFVLKSVSFETLTGHVSGNGAIIQDVYKSFIIKGQSDVSKIDIQKLFYTFNNFSQNVVKDKHLRGRLSGKVSFSSEWNNRLVFNKDKLLVDGDITITNGELVNFEPMMGLSKFVSLNELQNIKFSTLKNKIYVKDNQIVIPQMDIQSSAFNISGSGIHYFDNHYFYKVKVLLSEVLARKANRAKRENSEFGIIEDDGLGRTSIYLSIQGINSDYKISYDSRKALDVVKESFAKQKNELKDVLNHEFGWFKNDSALVKRNKNKRSSIMVEWDDQKNVEVPIKKEPENSTKVKPSKKITDEKVKVEWE